MQQILVGLTALNQRSSVVMLKNVLLALFIYKTITRSYKNIKLYGLLGTCQLAYTSIVQKLIRFARTNIPGTESLVKNEIKKAVDSIQKGMVISYPNQPQYQQLPPTSVGKSDLIKQLDQHLDMGHVNWKDGKVSGAIYHGGDELSKIITEAYSRFVVANPLHPEIFPGIRKMESEIISMVLNMYHGDSNTCGSITSGGSESILMSIKTHRDWALATKGITEPEMVVPVTVHAAFDKGSNYFGVKIVHIPVSEVTGQVDIQKVASAINSNTIMLVGSTPGFPHGIMDNIPELAKLALKHNIGLHVDSCLGGFIVPFMEKAGYPLPYQTDFRVEGVTAISCDPHKYGFAPKGGVYGSPSMAGSRPGSLSAGCWAAMLHMGLEGYVTATKKIVTATRKLKDGISRIPQLELIGDPILSVVAFKAKSPINIYAINELLSKKHYHLNALQFPSSIHICLTLLTVPVVDKMIADIEEAVQTVLANPKAGDGEMAAIYGTAASVSDRSIISDVTAGFLDGLTMVAK
ncbi:Sphingosine-1-phosphate lyase 1 [Globomyces sp. JEL0801]|nr:Sphingosine-1-phosphate lyase 1 [Globomyces sp. JEL0801]